jgi:hypothetical protein
VLATLATAQSEENDTVNKKEDIKSTVHDFFNVGSSEQLTTSTHHLSGIENFQLTFVDDLISSSETLARRNLFPKERENQQQRAPFGSKIQLSFSVVGGDTYDNLALDLHYDLLGDTRTYRSVDKDVTRSNIIPNHAYKGSLRGENGGELGWIRATVVNQNEIFLYMFDYRKGALKFLNFCFCFDSKPHQIFLTVNLAYINLVIDSFSSF